MYGSADFGMTSSCAAARRARADLSGDRGGVRAKNFADAFSALGRLPSRLEVAPVFPRESAREAPPLFSRAARLVCGVPWPGLHLVQRPAGEVIPADKSRLGPYAGDGILGLVGLAFNRHGGASIGASRRCSANPMWAGAGRPRGGAIGADVRGCAPRVSMTRPLFPLATMTGDVDRPVAARSDEPGRPPRLQTLAIGGRLWRT